MSKPVPVSPPAQVAAAPMHNPAVPPVRPVLLEKGSAGVNEGAPQKESHPVEGLTYLAVSLIKPNRYQPRQNMDESALKHLAESIRQDGLMQPIVVRRQNGGFELVAGERRWRAAQLVKLDKVPAIVRELSDQQIAEWALVENLQREDLNPIERAQAFQVLASQFGLSHEQVAQRVGVERPTVSNMLRLLELPQSIQDLIRGGKLSAGHAKPLLTIQDQNIQLSLAAKAVAGGWSVRAMEAAVKARAGGVAKPVQPSPREAHLVDLEQQLGQQLQTKVRIRPGRKKGSGALTIEFFSLDQFDALLAKLGVKIE